MNDNFSPSELDRILSAQDLLAGSAIIHDVAVPQEVLRPGAGTANGGTGTGDAGGKLRLRPLSVAAITLISRAARDDISLVPLLMLKESLVEPELSLEQIRQMHAGLVEFLVNRVNIISGLGPEGRGPEEAVDSPMGRTHLLLAKHFGWTPDQVAQLTPGQVAVYLAGIDKLMRLEDRDR